MLQKEINNLFNNKPNVFGIAEDILIAGLDANIRDHDIRLEQLM